MRTLRTLAAAALVLAAIALVACGGDDPSAASSGSGGGGSGKPRGPDAETRRAMLAYARCMRERGIDMPDPTFGENGARITQKNEAGRTTPEQQRAAEQACRKYQDQIKPPPISEEEQAKMREQALAFARCMREHGIDMPDPQFEENGGILQRIGPRGGVDENDAKFREAERACRDSGPGGPMTGGAP
jgi:hypothetical protein